MCGNAEPTDHENTGHSTRFSSYLCRENAPLRIGLRVSEHCPTNMTSNCIGK
jgi:hypothetical protein